MVLQGVYGIVIKGDVGDVMVRQGAEKLVSCHHQDRIPEQKLMSQWTSAFVYMLKRTHCLRLDERE